MSVGRARIGLLALALAGCSGRTEIDLTLDFTSLSAAQISAIRSLHLEVNGDLHGVDRAIPIDHQLDGGEGRLVYLPGVSTGTIEFAVDAYDAMGTQAAYNHSGMAGPFIPVDVHAGRASSLTLTMEPSAASSSDLGVSDGGIDSSVADLAGEDLAAARDLAVPDLAATLDLATPLDFAMPLDFATPPDLTGVDLTGTTGTPCSMGLLCENFEECLPGTDTTCLSKWSPTLQDGVITIVGAGAAVGTRAIELSLAAAGADHSVYFTANQLFGTLPVYIRFYARNAGAAFNINNPSSQLALLNFGPGSPSTLTVQLDSAASHLFQTSFSGTSTGFMNATSATLNTTWDCYEFQVTSTKATLLQNKAMIAWVSYASSTSFAGSPLTFIVEGTPGTNSLDVEYDDILVSAAPNLCP